ncbi:hypothetical protein [Microbacterium sp. SORGH_AS_0862]|uniref:hypothetical protein n=1 Tax=Microbacterium sp. SORGH_AS_0862 TaxID=3041789 RepID=UPI002790BEB5|nr:hypothetical protein [Microbacterium sp. SORGH_AS_0862]MDQ1206201.1 hypothetical protein [Microbacterium sp. SORGH_AS_0862]
MSVQHIAKARVVKVTVGGATGNRLARVLFAGDPVPENVDEDQIKRLLDRGLIEPISEESNEVELPEGEPTDKWSVPQLKKYAGDKSIDLGAAKKKDELLAAIAAAAQPAGN